MFDRRGTGLSDAVSGDRLPTLEARMDDIGAVMDAAGTARAVLIGMEDGAGQCFLFAATYPERTTGIITWSAESRGSWAPDAPWLATDAGWDAYIARDEAEWGTPSISVRWSARSARSGATIGGSSPRTAGSCGTR